MRLTFAPLLTLIVLTGCTATPTATGWIDRLRQPSAACAAALAGDRIEAARAECVPLLAGIEAGAGW